MDRRGFLTSAALLAGASALSTGCASSSSLVMPSLAIPAAENGVYSVPQLQYSYDSLEPFIDTATMKLHHDTHHAAYVKNLNGALTTHPELAKTRLEVLLADLTLVPEDVRDVVKNHGGGHFNHSLFWSSMNRKGKSAPEGQLASAVASTFGSFDTFKTKFQEAGMKRFGSGWVWLVKNPSGAISIISTANQDTPLAEGLQPLLGNDVWEHAYYLKYQSKRAEYLSAWWSVVDWAVVEKRFAGSSTIA